MLPEIARHSEKFYYFYEIANAGSLQATARKLRITAPSLSHAVKQLESIIGAILFHRSKSGVRLTDAGETLFAFCRKYFREMEEVQRAIDHPERKALRKIKIGTFQSIALYFWPLLNDSLHNASDLSVSITTNRSKGILESLIKREIDIAITVETFKDKNLIKHELFKDDYAFYISATHGKKNLKKSQILENPLLYIPDAIDENGISLQQYLHSWDLTFKDEFELDSLEIIGEFVKNGYGIGILPTKVAKTYGHSLKQLKVPGLNSLKFGSHRFFLSYRDDLEIPQSLIRLLVKSAKEAAIQLNS